MKNWTSLLHFSLEPWCLQKAEVMIPTYLKKHDNNLNIEIVYPKASKNNKAVYWWSFKDMSWKNDYYTIKQTNSIFLYLLKNAKKIDYLHLIHFVKSTFLLWLLYKFLNPKWKLYVMMDFDPYKHDISTVFGSDYPIIGKFMIKFVNFFISKTDCISIESSTWYEFLLDYSNAFKNKLVYMPNWFDEDEMSKYSNPNIKKENIILTVWRIGSYQKNTELLMNSIAHLSEASEEFNKSGWKCYCVWPIKQWFQSYIDKFYEEHPKTKNKLFFTWWIFNKEELYSWYQKSKIFCLPSRHESFWIVLVEALYFKNYLITTDICSAADITNNGEVWTIIKQEDNKWLTEVIEKVIKEYPYYINQLNKLYENSIQNFSWDYAVLKIYNMLCK